MFLKKIALQGFKSFADRTEFDFGPGITAVVGPNGCGKSNIVDAVRWVLGEQSARSLRGGKMLDVVFAGSRSRKPASFAQVELTFDNRARVLRSDDEEVVVGRLLYASGESEYRLNGTACRLKDIRELLLDTGVGVDAYSIIEQGRVDLLLQASPTERREIFEEAAGISRYKVRRIEAQRKLERTQNNLLRLQDIVEELERRLRSVRLAAGKARNYQEYDARLRELRSSFSMAEYHELTAQATTVQQRIEQLSTDEQAARASLSEVDAEAAEHSHKLQALDDQVQTAESELLELQSQVSALGERINQNERRHDELCATRDRRHQQAGEAARRLRELEERVSTEEQARDELSSAEARVAGQLDELHTACQQAEQRATAQRTRLEQEKVAAYEAVRRAALLQNELENVRQQHARLTQVTERLAERVRELEHERGTVVARCEDLGGQMQDVDARLTNLQHDAQREEQRQAQLQQAARELDDKIGVTKEERSGILSRLALLEDLEQRLEGVDAGTRAVLAWRDTAELADVVCGLVADLLRIDDPRVGLLQPILASFESHVAVADLDAFLAERVRRGAEESLGAVRVLDLSGLSRSVPLLKYDGVPGVVARALDWVRCAPEYQNLAAHLLGRTIIVENLAAARRLAAEAPAGYTFVTCAGELVGADGRLAFDTPHMSSGLISRKAEIRQLGVQRDEVETQLERLVRQRGALQQELSDAQLRHEGVLNELAKQQRIHAELRSEQARAHDARGRVERELKNVGGELASEQESLAGVQARLAALDAECGSVDAAQQEHESHVAALAEGLRALDAERAALSQQHADARVEKERLTEKRVAADQALDELHGRCRAAREERVASEREAVEAVAQIEAVEHELADTRQQHDEKESACGSRREEVVALRAERQQIRQRIEACGTAARDCQRRIEEIENALHGEQIRLREVEVRREELVARVRDELELDLAARYAEYEHSQQDWESVKAEIQELRGKIARLGNVNLDAIYELEELTPRYEHLTSQRSDLEESIARLERLIAELDEESRTRFAATFEEVRRHFQEMFRKLFGGGKADVFLEEPENPLECGIEIVARPPGKEPQSISLLSGGEKTMTAVALLMAVFRSRPSPFAILDEVDAALDESNVGRFNTLLTEFLSQSQFVVITHSKRTMSSADVLYGITMEEPGVSKRVSVRFEDRVNTPSVA